MPKIVGGKLPVKIGLRWHTTGIYYGGVPPVPIPNTEVKPVRAEDSWREAACENRSLPVQE